MSSVARLVNGRQKKIAAGSHPPRASQPLAAWAAQSSGSRLGWCYRGLKVAHSGSPEPHSAPVACTTLAAAPTTRWRSLQHDAIGRSLIGLPDQRGTSWELTLCLVPEPADFSCHELQRVLRLIDLRIGDEESHPTPEKPTDRLLLFRRGKRATP